MRKHPSMWAQMSIRYLIFQDLLHQSLTLVWFKTVCGEDCNIQICPLCMSEKSDIVDLILYRTLDDVDPDQETLDELLITIPKCGHIFTVETLDGHCGMTDYYRRNETDETWVGLEAPPSGFKQPPVCPNCRAAITSPRYGRIFKRADLDILERNLASSMSHGIASIQTSMRSVDKPAMKSALEELGSKTTVPPPSLSPNARKTCQKARAEIIKKTRYVPAPVETLYPDNAKFCGVSPSAAKAWKSIVQPLVQGYSKSIKIASTRSAHINAWEAAFSCIYDQEMDAATADPSRAPRRPAEHAMRMAKSKVGQPQPRADKRFVVEAFWVALDIRFTLAELASALIKASFEKGTSVLEKERYLWAVYCKFLLDVCSSDSEIAFRIAEESQSRRQMTKTAVFIMRAELELFRFNIEMLRHNKALRKDRETLVGRARNKAKEAEVYMSSIQRSHMAIMRPEEEDWLEENFSQTGRLFLEEWRNIETSLRHDTTYEPVSLAEKTQIVQALNFSKMNSLPRCVMSHMYLHDRSYRSFLYLPKRTPLRHHRGERVDKPECKIVLMLVTVWRSNGAGVLP